MNIEVHVRQKYYSGRAGGPAMLPAMQLPIIISSSYRLEGDVFWKKTYIVMLVARSELGSHSNDLLAISLGHSSHGYKR